jgi:acetoacetate decarboxylase
VGFVKTAEEIRKIQSIYSRIQFLNTRNLTVTFETTPESIRGLLPPPLEPTPEPLGAAWVGDIGNSNCVGPFVSLALYIRARYGDIIGNYCVASAMSTPEATIFARDLWGEPAKLAKLTFESQDEFVWGSAERYEVRYMSLRGRLTGASATGRREHNFFHFKYAPRADGTGFDGPPQLVMVTADTTVEVGKRGRGELVFRDSAHDPVSEIRKASRRSCLHAGATYVPPALCEGPDEFIGFPSKTDALDVAGEDAAARAGRRRREWPRSIPHQPISGDLHSAAWSRSEARGRVDSGSATIRHIELPSSRVPVARLTLVVEEVEGSPAAVAAAVMAPT